MIGDRRDGSLPGQWRLYRGRSMIAAGPGAHLLPIRTERLLLRALEPGDGDALHRLYGDPEAMRYVGSGGARTREQTEVGLARLIRHQEQHGFGMWMVENGDGPIGVAGLMLVEGSGPDVEVVYELERAAWGQGYATEAARACLGVGFERLGVGRILALAYPQNAASINVMRKLGMKPAGSVLAYGAELVRYEVRSASA
jgi:[ribosomal protein S5]-alanine N-acetyltransferase